MSDPVSRFHDWRECINVSGSFPFAAKRRLRSRSKIPRRVDGQTIGWSRAGRHGQTLCLRFSARVLEARTIRLCELGGARMGVRAEASRGCSRDSTSFRTDTKAALTDSSHTMPPETPPVQVATASTSDPLPNDAKKAVSSMGDAQRPPDQARDRSEVWELRDSLFRRPPLQVCLLGGPTRTLAAGS